MITIITIIIIIVIISVHHRHLSTFSLPKLNKHCSLYKNVRHVLWLLSKQWLIISTWERFALVQQAKAQHVTVSTNLKTMEVHHTVISPQWVCHSRLINMNKEGWIKVFGLNLPHFLTWDGENGPASHSSYQERRWGESFQAFVCHSFPVMTGWVQRGEGVEC